MRTHLACLCALIVLSMTLGACGKDKGGASASNFKQENTRENLTALLKAVKKAQEDDNMGEAGALTRLLLPDEGRLSKAFRPDVPKAEKAKMMKMISRFSSADDKKLGGLLRSRKDQTEIQVHCATTEEIAANKPGTVVFKKFPGATVTLAKTMLKPGLTFCEVEFLVPYQERGMKYHLFFWDGHRWTMLGPVWRALK